MEFWFSEMHTDNVKISVRVNRQLFGAQSDFQRIDVFDSPEFGLFLTSDGSIIFSEKDEFTYDEMIVHVPMAVHPNVRRVLVIGGGDGGVARELSYYDEIEAIDVVEPDKMFVDVCREFFPDNAKGLDDPRVTVYYQDGLRFLRAKQDAYDLIINDSTDPLGHTAGLFTKEFYGSCYKALHDDGIMVYQHGSPFYDEDEEPLPRDAPQGVPLFPDQPRVSGAHPDLRGRATGCSALHRRNTTRSPTWMRRAGTAAASRRGTTRPTCIWRVHAAEICGGSFNRGRKKLTQTKGLLHYEQTACHRLRRRRRRSRFTNAARTAAYSASFASPAVPNPNATRSRKSWRKRRPSS